MKKIIKLFLAMLLLASVTGCKKAGMTDNVEVKPVNSTIFSNDEINSTVNCIKEYFKENFKDCKLLSLEYIGDEANDKEASYYLSEYEADKLISFKSCFEVLKDTDTTPKGLESDFYFYVGLVNGNWQVITCGRG